MCERLAVMYQGKIVELGPTEDVLERPLHPYTQALIAAVPVPDPAYRRPEPAVESAAPVAVSPPPTCRFLDRCPAATDHCRAAEASAAGGEAAGTLGRVPVTLCRSLATHVRKISAMKPDRRCGWKRARQLWRRLTQRTTPSSPCGYGFKSLTIASASSWYSSPRKLAGTRTIPACAVLVATAS
jgi:oligopeptide/dipeptide ABC transporter ATP-binding protein